MSSSRDVHPIMTCTKFKLISLAHVANLKNIPPSYFQAPAINTPLPTKLCDANHTASTSSRNEPIGGFFQNKTPSFTGDHKNLGDYRKVYYKIRANHLSIMRCGSVLLHRTFHRDIFVSPVLDLLNSI